MMRQVGFVLGVSILVAVLGTPGGADPVIAFDHGWVFMILISALGFVAALSIGGIRRVVIPAEATSVKTQVAGPLMTG